MNGFCMAWRAIAPGLARYLRRRGVVPDDVEDVVQETALRLFVVWPRIDSEASVEPLARTIALNVWRDHLRTRAARDVRVADVPDMPDAAACVERTVLARVELARVVAVVRLLPREDRAALAVGTARALGVSCERPATAADRMRLMRCRRALRSPAEAGAAAAQLQPPAGVPGERPPEAATEVALVG
jgi:RNA polymerase sigma factor (sigma-70 family)